MQLRTLTTTADLDALLTTARTSPGDLTDDQVHDLIELVDATTAALEPAVRVWASLLIDAVKAADYLLHSLPPIVLQIVLHPNDAIAAALAAASAPASTLPAPSAPTPAPEPTPTPEPTPAPDVVPSTGEAGADGADDPDDDDAAADAGTVPTESLANRPSS